MNCTCISDLEQRLANHLRPEAGDDAKATAMNTAFAISDDLDMYMALQIPYRVKGSGKGYSRANGKEMPVHATYCPFCARPTRPGAYTVGEDAGIAAYFPAPKEEVSHAE